MVWMFTSVFLLLLFFNHGFSSPETVILIWVIWVNFIIKWFFFSRNVYGYYIPWVLSDQDCLPSLLSNIIYKNNFIFYYFNIMPLNYKNNLFLLQVCRSYSYFTVENVGLTYPIMGGNAKCYSCYTKQDGISSKS